MNIHPSAHPGAKLSVADMDRPSSIVVAGSLVVPGYIMRHTHPPVTPQLDRLGLCVDKYRLGMASPPRMNRSIETAPRATLHVPEDVRLMLDEVAVWNQESAEDALIRAVEKYWGERFDEVSSAECAALRQDPDAWHDYQREVSAWDATLMDGLGDE